MDLLSQPWRRRGEKLALIGALLQVISVVGSFVAVGWQQHAMNSLVAHGPTSLTALGNVIGPFGTALNVCLMGEIASLVCLCVALTILRCRVRWFFWFLATYSWFLLLAFPVGTAAALFFLIYIFRHREEFLSSLPLRSP